MPCQPDVAPASTLTVVASGVGVYSLRSSTGTTRVGTFSARRSSAAPRATADLRTGGHDLDLRIVAGKRGPIELGQVLAGEDEGRGAVQPLQGQAPGASRVGVVVRPEDLQVGDRPEGLDVLDRLVRRAVFADGDGVVREDVDRRDVHQRGQAQRRTQVVGEYQEGAAERPEAAVQDHAVDAGGHAELTDAEGDF